MTTPLKYLTAYAPALQEQVRGLIAQGRLGSHLAGRYPSGHAIQSDKALYQYVCEHKDRYLRTAPAIDKVVYDSKLDVVHHALGLHTAISRVQGGKLKAKKEIRVASLFREVPEAFLQMIVVHELAHLKERNHNKAFYQLCCHMLADYHQLEFDLRLWLTLKELPEGS